MNAFDIKGKHCDDYIRDKSQPKCLRKFLLYHRIPATWRFCRWKDSWGTPSLFAMYKGEPVRVQMASRFGDVGITTKMNQKNGYELRVNVEDLTDFLEGP